MAISNSRKASHSAAPLVMCKPTAVRALSKMPRTRSMPPAAPMPPIEYCAYSNQISGPVCEKLSKKKQAYRNTLNRTKSRTTFRRNAFKTYLIFCFYFLCLLSRKQQLLLGNRLHFLPQASLPGFFPPFKKPTNNICCSTSNIDLWIFFRTAFLLPSPQTAFSRLETRKYRAKFMIINPQTMDLICNVTAVFFDCQVGG